jgi:hypothetical protein
MLTRDGALQLTVDDDAAAQVRGFLPFHAVAAAQTDLPAPSLRIDVRRAPDSRVRPTALPRIAGLGSTALHLDGDHATVRAPGIDGVLRLDAGRAGFTFTEHATDVDAMHALSFAAALLLARHGRYLLHAAAVMPPGADTVTLLVGDGRSGKTTTALDLARAGWRLLSDDHVVIAWRHDAWWAEGWTRVAHLDEGWPDAAPAGRRVALDPRSIPGIALADEGPVADVLLPRVSRMAPCTSAVTAAGSDVLSMLLRNSAWSIADRAAAPGALRAFAELARLPRLTLALCSDTFNDPRRLDSVLRHPPG